MLITGSARCLNAVSPLGEKMVEMSNKAFPPLTDEMLKAGIDALTIYYSDYEPDSHRRRVVEDVFWAMVLALEERDIFWEMVLALKERTIKTEV